MRYSEMRRPVVLAARAGPSYMQAAVRRRFRLSQPGSFLELFRGGVPPALDLADAQTIEAWAVVGLAALARRNGSRPLHIHFDPAAKASQFAHALGLRDVIDGNPQREPLEPSRTASLRRITRVAEAEAIARDIGRLLVPESADDDSRRTIIYVLVELLRNAVQHSEDVKGGVVAAQRMNAGYANYPRDVVQVAVGDAGIGLPAALARQYPNLDGPEASVVKALEPHVSGAFEEGRTGSAYNAGMGLFMLAEMAKLTAGRMLLATRGAALWLRGDLEDVSKHKLNLLPGLGFPGTLVAFELPFGEPADHDGLITTISERRRERAVQQPASNWVRFERAPADATALVVSTLREDVELAALRSREVLQSELFQRRPVALDFRNVDVCTQSFLHALLFEVLRLSWAVQVPVYIENATPGVTVGVQLVGNYARSG